MGSDVGLISFIGKRHIPIRRSRWEVLLVGVVVLVASLAGLPEIFQSTLDVHGVKLPQLAVELMRAIVLGVAIHAPQTRGNGVN